MTDAAATQQAIAPGTVLVAENGHGLFGQDLLDGRHALIADEPMSAGGKDAGPNPYELLLMSLGACTSMTLRLYARRKQLPLTRVSVRLRHSRIHAEDCADCETKRDSSTASSARLNSRVHSIHSNASACWRSPTCVRCIGH